MSEALTDDMIGYALVRETDTFDNSVTVKFVFVFWLGDHANRMQKARTSTHMGFIKSFIGVRTPIPTTKRIWELPKMGPRPPLFSEPILRPVTPLIQSSDLAASLLSPCL